MPVTEGTGLGGVLSTVGHQNFTAATFKYVSITGYEEVVAEIDDTHLGSTTFEETIPASLASLPPITVQIQWDYGETPAFAGGTGLSVGETADIAITMPTRTAYPTTTGTLTANAFITNVKMPDHTTGDRSIGSITFKFTGKTTKPTLTAST